MDALDRPITLRCGLEIPSRIAMAPLTNTQSHADGTLADDELNWLVRRARGGFRWIETCAAFVCEEGHAWRGQLGVATDDHVPGLIRLASNLRDNGATPMVQLHHGGAAAKLAPDRPLSTADGIRGHSRGASHDDLERVIAEFVRAAQRAETAGRQSAGDARVGSVSS